MKQSRLDWYDDVLADEDAQARFKPTYTEDGFLQVRAPLTNIGVFTYLTADGTVQRELRTPEQVLDAASYNTLHGVPLTIDHPADKVTPENAKALSVGSISGISTDSYRVYADITITDKEAIEAVKNGKRALSCGYTCDTEQKQGVWMGVEYDAIQTNIKYNHVALVDRGRAGDDARIRFDSFDAVLTKDLGKERRDQQPKEDKHMNKIRLDGVKGTFNADEEVVDYIETLTKQLAEAEARVSELTKELETEVAKAKAEADAQKETKEGLEQELKELKAEIPALVAEAVKEQTELVEEASKADVEIKADMTAKDLKTAIVLKVFPKADKEALKQDAYLQARYDGAKEILSEKIEESKQAQVAEGKQDTSQRTDSLSKRQEMINQYLNAYKGKEQ